MKHINIRSILSLPFCFCIVFCLFLAGCGAPVLSRKNAAADKGAKLIQNTKDPAGNPVLSSASDNAAAPSCEGLWENKEVCLFPSADGKTVYENASASIDVSNCSEGYIMINYMGSASAAKLQLTGPSRVTYTYNLCGGSYEAFPLSQGDGIYTAVIYENVIGDTYSALLSQTFEVSLQNEFGPYLYPNQRINFNSSSFCVRKAAELTDGADSELTAVERIYNYVVGHVVYDYEKANRLPVTGGYIADPDETLNSGRGICLDYAVLMTSMLRSRGIPTRLEVGYVGSLYHAWISVHVKDVGWINNVIEFNGQEWKLMDPTFATDSTDRELEEQIGNGNRYVAKYFY